jgi:hypothetical protein
MIAAAHHPAGVAGREIAMYVPSWIGFVGFVLLMLFTAFFLAGNLWVAVGLMIPAYALVILESKYTRGLIRAR